MFAGFTVPLEVARSILRAAADIEDAQGRAPGDDSFVGFQGAPKRDFDGIGKDLDGRRSRNGSGLFDGGKTEVLGSSGLVSRDSEANDIETSRFGMGGPVEGREIELHRKLPGERLPGLRGGDAKEPAIPRNLEEGVGEIAEGLVGSGGEGRGGAVDLIGIVEKRLDRLLRSPEIGRGKTEEGTFVTKAVDGGAGHEVPLLVGGKNIAFLVQSDVREAQPIGENLGGGAVR